MIERVSDRVPLHILVIGAHPDDCEFSVGGSAARWRARGDHVKFVSVTNGDAGHFGEEYLNDRARLSKRRMKEAQAAAAVIGAEFETMDVHDGEVYVTRELTEAMVCMIRRFGSAGQGPDLVLTNRPVDYHRDHRYTSRLVLDATYILTVPLVRPDVPHLNRMPVFAYWFDRFTEGGVFRPDVVVDIDDVHDTKVRMVASHVSQVFEWLPYNAGILDQVPRQPDDRLSWFTPRLRDRDARAVPHCEQKWRELCNSPGMDLPRCVEAFQISEYGRQPARGELSALFLID